MVLHLQTYYNRAGHVYIGVSKLSCIACSIFIQEFNRTSNTSFSTRDCHQKWYFSWEFPLNRPADLYKAIYNHVSNVLAKDLAVRGLSRSRASSDSSTAFIDSTGVSEAAIKSYMKSMKKMASSKGQHLGMKYQ
jgi:hypothetical protein